jgi:hypothetical protein
MTINSATNMNDPTLNKTYMDMLKLEMKKAKDLSIRNKVDYVIVITCQKEK